MATGSELQLINFASEACAKPRLDFESTFFSFARSQWILRRANEPQKCFVSGETESVANTSAFVGPVAFNSAVVPLARTFEAEGSKPTLCLFGKHRPTPGLDALRAQNDCQTEPIGLH